MTQTAGTVLVADDDSDLRSLYRCWLTGADEVRTAADGAAALSALDGTVDAVLLDRQMPGTDGVAVAREIERRDVDPAVVMISGVEPGVELLAVPVDDYCRKPVTRETVHTGLHRALAVAEQPLPRRRLLSLDTRRRVVEASVPMPTLADEPAYRRAVDTLDRQSEVLRAARDAVDTDDRADRATTPGPTLRNSV